MKKHYSPTGRTCRVTFEVPAAAHATSAVVCGEFNDWDTTCHALTRRKDGRLSLTLSLPAGRRYRFRYLVDSERWENDWAADAYEPNHFGTDDSVLSLLPEGTAAAGASAEGRLA